jgi:hypothetical protein
MKSLNSVLNQPWRKRQRQRFRRPKSSSIGAVYIVYNTDPALTTSFILTTLNSARSIRQIEPDLPITLMASPFNESVKPLIESLFTDFIPIPESIVYPGRQWMTRILAFSMTPYRFTISLDADTYICAPFSKDIKKVMVHQDLDLAFNGHEDLSVYPTHPDNGVFVFKKSKSFKRLLKRWFLWTRKRSAMTKDTDDQVPLRQVLLFEQLGLKYGRLSPIFGARVRPAEGEPWDNTPQRIHDHTLVLSGPVRVLHAFVFTYYNPKAVCSFINQRLEPRVVLFNRKTYPLLNSSSVTKHLQLAYSLKECNALLDAQCLSRMRWQRIPHVLLLDESLKAILPWE